MIRSDLHIAQRAANHAYRCCLCLPGWTRRIQFLKSGTTNLLVCLAWISAFFWAPNRLSATELQPETVKAFDQYVQKAELRMHGELKSGRTFLWVDSLPGAERTAAYTRLRNGEILVHSLAAGLDIPGGMIHDWMGIVFIPNTTIDAALAQIQAYNDYARIYHPEMRGSKLLERDGNNFKVSIWLQKKSFATVVIHVVENVQYVRLDPFREYSVSHSIRVAEVENPGTPQQYEDPPGTGHGYLWRLNDYRRFLQTSSGVYLQFEVIALSRDIPWGLEWLIKPFVTKLPRQSLLFTLARARASIEAAERPTTTGGDGQPSSERQKSPQRAALLQAELVFVVKVRRRNSAKFEFPGLEFPGRGRDRGFSAWQKRLRSAPCGDGAIRAGVTLASPASSGVGLYSEADRTGMKPE